MGATQIDWLGRLKNLEAAVSGGPNVAGASVPIPTPEQLPVPVLTGSADAITAKTGLVVINASGVDACTLANPIAGGYGVGDDGKTLKIWVNTAQAHTVTTGAHGLNGNKNIATAAGALGNMLTLQAWNGVWLVEGNSGFTLSGS